MFSTVRSRLITIAILAGIAIYSLVRSPLKLGLDLQGGVHMALEVDQSRGAVPDAAGALQRALTVIRTRIDEFGVAEPLIQQVGTSRIVVELPGQKDPARAREVVQRSAFLEFRITDMQNQFRAALPAIDAELFKSGVRGPAGARAAGAVEQLLGGDSTKKATKDTSSAVLSGQLFSGQTAWEFLVPAENFAHVDSLKNNPLVKRLMPRGIELMWATDVNSQGGRSYWALYAVENRPIITGEYLVDARAQLDPVYNQSVVTFQLSRTGGRIFGRETARHVNDHMAIILDGRVQGAPPVIRSQINTRGQIELSGTLQEAQDLALVLRAGALPAPLAIVESGTVGPSLGSDSIRAGINAGIAGTVLVILIMVSYYRVAGVLSVIALGFYILFTVGGLGVFGATLTLPGLAGLVLSIGIAVDANVLIFERIREELAGGKTIPAAVDLGFRRAMSAIVDSNVCAIITAALLYQFGTGAVRGFAVTLILGVLASMVTAIFVTRTFFMLWLQKRPGMQTLSI